jgi:DNA-binding NarL/FixJ family response regulator
MLRVAWQINHVNEYVTLRRSSPTPPGDRSCEVARVLLVDDNEAMLARAASILTPDCMVVGAVRDGRAALDAAQVMLPDVIVIDISMPGINGIEVAGHLRQSGSTAALVFLSLYDEEEMIQAARDAGGIGYVVKHRLTTDLKLAVREALAGRPFTSPSP